MTRRYPLTATNGLGDNAAKIFDGGENRQLKHTQG